jgi:hypothetical protein
MFPIQLLRQREGNIWSAGVLVTEKEPFSGSKKEGPIPRRCMLDL